jgi:hypothetical protein
MTDTNVIKSVLGFDLKAEILDKDNNPILTGAKSIMPEDFVEQIQNKTVDRKWFTNYNQSLLDKIADYRKYNL